MDPLTVVFAAIAMYANEIHDTERSSELRGIYLELMRLIEERYLGQNTLTTVNAYQNGDSSAQLTMVNAFHQLDAAGDEELLSSARSLLTMIEAQNSTSSAAAWTTLEGGIPNLSKEITTIEISSTGHHDLVVGTDPESSIELEPSATDAALPRSYDVWFATNRELQKPGDPSGGFMNRPAEPEVIHYGKCTVNIPKAHLFGSLGTGWWARWRKLDFRDDHLKIESISGLGDRTKFFASLHDELSNSVPSDRQILVYLHGYNVTFEESALRAAQMGFDLKIPGATAFFSWPSCGTLAGYFADADRIAASERAIAQFLEQMVSETGAETVHLIAHSMGNRGLARAFQRLFANASQDSGVRFGQIILAAPDIEASLFKELAAIFPRNSKRTTMYVSARDKALEMSHWLQASSRAGFTPPITVVPGIDTIEVTDIDLTILGHAYFAEADGVIRDMFDILHFDAAPQKRARTRIAGTAPPHWIIAR